MVRVEHRCPDGSPFPVTYADPADVGFEWLIDLEHAPTAMTPLADQVRRVGQPGEARAYAACGVTMPAVLGAPRPRANGYAYHRALDLSTADEERLGVELRALAEAYGGGFGAWERGCLPGVQAACDQLAGAPATTPFAVLAEAREYAWGLTSVAGLVARLDELAVARLCEPAFGDRATAIAYELAQGSENETTTADRSIAVLARLKPGSSAEREARAAFLATYGSRSVGWPIDEPTLVERPDLLDAQVALLRRHLDDGRDGVAAAAERRERLAAEVEAGLDAAARARFRRRLDRLAGFVPVREARARWQLVATGAMRQVVLARGRSLVDAGMLEQSGDVFFLLPAEYDEPHDGLAPVVAERRVDHDRWRAATPPTRIGGDDHADGGPTPPNGSVLVGIGGAPGVATGPARVVRDLTEVDRFEPGDVLVTTMTSPAWTPLFALAAAVVTDAGDALSHVAIAAREYGIPCVAGTGFATVRIPDGGPVTVDGDAGTVRFG